MVSLFYSQKDNGAWASQSRVWRCSQLCAIENTVDLSLGPKGKPDFDLSIVNVAQLTQRSQCAFDVSDVSGSIKNGYFVVNASLDLTSSQCD